MKSFIVLIPAILAAIYSWVVSPRKAFVDIYLPCLLLLPIIYKLELSGLPDYGFAQMTLIPIVGVHLFRARLRSLLQVNFLDIFVLLYVALCVYSEYTNTGHYQSAEGGILWINLLANQMTMIIFPYFAAKWFILPGQLSVPVSKRICTLLIITLIICAWEWRFVVNAHISIFGWFFPDQEFWIPTYRYGVVRISGPFPHPILLGIAFGVAILLNFWLVKNNFWKKNFFLLPPLPLSKGSIYTLILIAGLLFTISRAPIVGTFIGFLFLGVAKSNNRKISLLLRLGFLGFLGLLGMQFFIYYANVNRALADSQLTDAAAYRVEMLYKYLPFVQEKLHWGWGLTSLPESAGLKSIDNEFLWITLKHGIYAMLTFLSIFIFAGIALLRRGINPKCEDPIERTFCMTMVAILFMLGSSLITVYMGGQIRPLFFIIVGWTQGYLSTEPGEESVRLLTPNPKKAEKVSIYHT